MAMRNLIGAVIQHAIRRLAAGLEDGHAIGRPLHLCLEEAVQSQFRRIRRRHLLRDSINIGQLLTHSFFEGRLVVLVPDEVESGRVIRKRAFDEKRVVSGHRGRGRDARLDGGNGRAGARYDRGGEQSGKGEAIPKERFH